MTLTTQVRIHWPVSAEGLLDHVTRVAGGDPATVGRAEVHGMIRNKAGQGLRTLAYVRWSESPDIGCPEEMDYAPPALVELSLDNPYGYGHENRGRYVQANELLPAVRAWLDEQGVPRDRWWWEDETAGTYHPGTVPVEWLDTADDRETWQPDQSPR